MITGDTNVNLKKDLMKLAQENGKLSLSEYTFTVLSPDKTILGDKDEMRLNIGHVFHGGFSQIRGRGIGLGFIEQLRENNDVEILNMLK